MNGTLAANLALPTAAALVGLIVGLLFGNRSRPPAAPPPARRATSASDFVRSVAVALGIDPRAVSLTGLSVDAAVHDQVATVLFQAVAVDQSPEDVRRAIVDAVRRNVLAAQAGADRKLTQALDALRDDLNRIVAEPLGPGERRNLAAETVARTAADRITAALGEWATAAVPGLFVEVTGPDGVGAIVPPPTGA